jgi:hypothetical protein
MNQLFLRKDETSNSYFFLNTDISFSDKLPKHIPTFSESNGVSSSHSIEHFSTYNPEDYAHPAQNHSNKPHVHDTILDDFSWAIVTPMDSAVDQHKKKIIKTLPSSQVKQMFEELI